jgi:hypothetical protein
MLLAKTECVVFTCQGYDSHPLSVCLDDLSRSSYFDNMIGTHGDGFVTCRVPWRGCRGRPLRTLACRAFRLGTDRWSKGGIEICESVGFHKHVVYLPSIMSSSSKDFLHKAR